MQGTAPFPQCKLRSNSSCSDSGVICDCSRASSASGQCEEASYASCAGTPFHCCAPPLNVVGQSGLMLLTFITTHVFQFRFAEPSIIGTPQPSIVCDVVCSSTFLALRARNIFLSPFTNQVLAQLESLTYWKETKACKTDSYLLPRHLECTCQWINIVPVTVFPPSMTKQSNFDDVPFSKPGRAARTWLSQKALKGMKVATPSLNWITLSSTFGHGVRVLASD